MKLIRYFVIAKKEYRVISENIVLDRNGPGRAVFLIESGTAPESWQCAEYYLGYAGKSMFQVFSGYIENVKRIDARQVRIVMRDYVQLLDMRCPLSLRNTTAEQVLRQIRAKLGVGFCHGAAEEELFRKPIAHFVSLGTGMSAVQSIGRHLAIAGYTCKCMPDGEIYVGAAAGMPGAAEMISIPESFFSEKTVCGAVGPVIPSLQPWQLIRIGDAQPVRLQQINITGSISKITFEDVQP